MQYPATDFSSHLILLNASGTWPAAERAFPVNPPALLKVLATAVWDDLTLRGRRATTEPRAIIRLRETKFTIIEHGGKRSRTLRPPENKVRFFLAGNFGIWETTKNVAYISWLRLR